MIITSRHCNKVVKQEKLYQMDRILSHRSLVIRDSSMRARIQKELENYLTYIERYMKIFHQCIEWREKLAWINELYFVSWYDFIRDKHVYLFVEKNSKHSSTIDLIINNK